MARVKIVFLALCCLSTWFIGPVSLARAENISIPNFWDKYERYQKPDLSNLPRLRFLTTTDFPPFNFIDRKKRLSGFHIDLARAICARLDVLYRCQIQAVPWDELEKSLRTGDAEAVIAGLAISKEARKELAFSKPYLHIPGRFVIRKDAGINAPIYEGLFKKKTGVVQGSAHMAYFDEAFREREFVTFPSRQAALLALQEAKIDSVFADAVSLSFWLTSPASKDCCVFIDGAFLSESHFGQGMTVAFKKGDERLESGINYALQKINEDGTFGELYLRYFPLGLF